MSRDFSLLQLHRRDEIYCDPIERYTFETGMTEPLDACMPALVSNSLWIPRQPRISIAHRNCRVVAVLSDK
jgi:hypothetical protein